MWCAMKWLILLQGKHAALQAPAGQPCKESLDGVEPGVRGRREVEGPAGMACRPLAHVLYAQTVGTFRANSRTPICPPSAVEVHRDLERADRASSLRHVRPGLTRPLQSPADHREPEFRQKGVLDALGRMPLFACAPPEVERCSEALPSRPRRIRPPPTARRRGASCSRRSSSRACAKATASRRCVPT